MKIEIKRRVLSSALRAASELFPAHSPYSTLWIVPEAGRCVALSLNKTGECGIEEDLDCEVIDPGPAIGIPAGLSAEWVNNLPKDEDSISIAFAPSTTNGPARLSLKCGTSSVHVSPQVGLDRRPGGGEFAQVANIESSCLKKALDFAAGPERPEWCGLHLGFVQADLPVVFSGSGVMYSYVRADHSAKGVFIPRSVAEVAVGLRGRVEISESDRRFQLRCENRSVYGPKYSGGLVDWPRIISGLKFPAKVRVLREDLQSAVRTCHCLRGADKYTQIKFSLDGGGLTLSASTPVGTTAIRVAGKVTGSAEEKNIPSEQLLRVFSHASDDAITLEFGEARMPLQLTSKADAFTVGIVPMILKKL